MWEISKTAENLFKSGQTVDEGSFAEKETYGVVKSGRTLSLKTERLSGRKKVTGIPKDQIVGVAKTMAKAAPAVAVWMGPGPCMSPRGAYPSMAIHALAGLCACESEGGSLRAHASSPSGKAAFN